jgi:tRNA threonylcarbamoyladenosine biosynthesis protein TsaE
MKSGGRAKERRTVDVVTRSPAQTRRFGGEFAKTLPIPGIVLLRGALGSGKTTLARGIAQGLGVEDPDAVNSPSFTLVNIYQGFCPIYHVDLYRLRGERDLYLTGLDDFMGKEGVTIIEWSERLGCTPPEAAVIEMEDAGGDKRILHVSAPPGGCKKPNRVEKQFIQRSGSRGDT